MGAKTNDIIGERFRADVVAEEVRRIDRAHVTAHPGYVLFEPFLDIWLKNHVAEPVGVAE
jgi:hypothetical protein